MRRAPFARSHTGSYPLWRVFGYFLRGEKVTRRRHTAVQERGWGYLNRYNWCMEIISIFCAVVDKDWNRRYNIQILMQACTTIHCVENTEEGISNDS